MPKGYKKDGSLSGKVFKKGHKRNLGKKPTLGKHWKIKDTSKMKGHIPWLKGTKGLVKPNSGSFQKGHNGVNVSRGKNHWRWKGGITPKNKKIRNSIEFRLLREAVFARDNWTCQKYGIKGGKLHPHHIQNFAEYPELRFAIDNGITLSEKAHKEFHKIYGNKNNTREQIQEFLS